MKRRHSLPLRFGLLGGGQLARMLALKAHEIGLEVHVLSARSDDPAALVARHHHVGNPSSAKDARAFLKAVDVATFESEFMDSELLTRLSRDLKTPLRPGPELMGRIQDRLEQKRLLQSSKLPTAPFHEVSSLGDAKTAFDALDGRMVLKKRRFGYDGYGTFVIRSRRDLERIAGDVRAECENGFGFIGEAFIPFRRELAIMVARRPSGETTALPWVETYQENSRCLWVKGPIAPQGGAALARRLRNFLGEIGYAGVMGVELFDTGRGLLINELAPRVHNSGHYSLDALEEDQFTLHIKAVLDLPFSKTRILAPGFAMLNLLGSHDRHPAWSLPPGLHLHWYGKNDNRRGRKMGHVNCLGSTPGAALRSLLRARDNFQV